MPENQDDRLSRVVRGVRFDLIIALCALVISTLAAGASWWQARVLQAQTRVLAEQLGAQVWPYVGVSENISRDRADISIDNDGLGPAVLRSVTAVTHGRNESSFIDVLHAVLGPNLVARAHAHGERINIGISSGGPGWVLRPAESKVVFTLVSKLYAGPFIEGLQRSSFRICYCAIIPGKCWLSDSTSTSDPRSTQACPEIPNDLLHGSAVQQLFSRKF